MPDYKYQQINQMIRAQIRNQTLLPGDKIPSIRQLSRQLNVSIGTVQQAYAALEDQDLIFPKKRSGYYVKSRQRIFRPDTGAFQPVPSEVSILETAISVVRSAANKDLLQLGSAIPNVSGDGVRRLHQEFKRQANKVLNYEEDPSGYLPLRRRLARCYIDGRRAVDPEDIVITAGCQEALTIALRCIAEPGDTVLVESPCYYGVLQALEWYQIKAVEIPVCPDQGMDMGILASVLESWPVKGMILNPAFSNPTGYLYPEHMKVKILELLAAYDLPLIEDDVFSRLGFTQTHPRSIHSYDTDGRVILCGSISKMLSPDFRVGWMIPGRYFEKARTLKFVTTLCNPCHTQFALARFLASRQLERHLRTVAGVYEKRQRHMIRSIRKWFPASTQISRPEGGFLLWVRLEQGIDGLTLYRNAVSEGVCITPGEICSPTGRYKNYIRLNYAVASKAETESAVKILARLINCR
ncbi:MAG: PLP-dependent aminotransferase family protein [Desulfobacterales bacterium]|nr:PLP-dependent aminotransferase family protein [Desulfobacterales bacterium]